MAGARWGRLILGIVLVIVVLSLLLSMPGLVPR
jgi:hypothetical protein